MTLAQRELIEEFGLLHEQTGGTRMNGRVSAWLLLCDPPVQSLTEIADGLGVSKAAASIAARQLLAVGIVERISKPGHRGDFYRALAPNAADLLPVHHIKTLRGLLTSAIASVSDRDQAQSNYALMHELLEFTAFVEADYPALLERWRRSRSTATSSCAPFSPPDMYTSQSAGGTT